MNYDRAKFDRLERQWIALRAVADHLSEQYGEARQAYLGELGHLTRWLRSRVSHVRVGTNRTNERLVDLVQLAETVPAELLATVEKLEDDELRLSLLNPAKSLFRAYERMQSARDARNEHEATVTKFHGSFARLAEWVRKLENTVITIRSVK